MGIGSGDSLAGPRATTGMYRCLIALGLILGALAIGLVTQAERASAATDWVCRPGQAVNPCDGPLGVDAVEATGQTKTIDYKRPANPPVDCFYVYPTVSEEPGDIADHTVDKFVKRTTILQARQYSRVCRVFAPVYSQVTLNGLDRHGSETDGEYSTRVRGLMDIAYADLLSTWKDYLAHYNKGRGVILIGHSQGSFHLGRLITHEIDRRPSIRKRLISAILPGANIWVPKGKIVGGQFKHVPECESKTELGCVIAWSVYTAQPDPGDAFGRIGGVPLDVPPLPDPATDEVVCTNPAELSGDGGTLEPLANIGAYADPDAPEDAHPWWRWPDLYTAECKSGDNANWLNVSVRPDETRSLPHWIVYSPSETNLHVVDMTLAMGNLVRITQSESKVYVKRASATKNLAHAKARLKVLKRSLRQARRKCRQKGTTGSSIACRQAKALTRKTKALRRQIARYRRIVNG